MAALALRLRVDHPALGPRAVQSLLVQAAHPIRDVALQRQGAGAAAAPTLRALRIEPAIVASETRDGVTSAHLALSRLDGPPGRYVVAFTNGTSETILDGDVSVGVDGPRRLTLRLPSAAAGHLIIRDPAGASVATAPVLPLRPARTPGDALGSPEVSADARLAEVRVRLGTLRREDSRVHSVRVHGVRLDLLPEAGGDPLPVTGSKHSHTRNARASPRNGTRPGDRPNKPKTLAWSSNQASDARATTASRAHASVHARRTPIGRYGVAGPMALVAASAAVHAGSGGSREGSGRDDDNQTGPRRSQR